MKKRQTLKQNQLMKASTLLGAAVIMAAACSAQATLVVNDTFTPDATIPDGNVAGLTEQDVVSGVAVSGPIDNVTVSLDISGGFNGSLYGYLLYQAPGDGSTAMAVLLNRPGLGSGGVIQQNFGFSTAGMNVTLDDSITQPLGNINTTQSPTSGGTYNSAGGTLNTAFNGATANGTWTLFLADMTADGGAGELVSWSLTVDEPVPEPVTWALIIFGTLGVPAFFLKRKCQAAQS
jgi:subtilisin-like proprotein convertase family protein